MTSHNSNNDTVATVTKEPSLSLEGPSSRTKKTCLVFFTIVLVTFLYLVDDAKLKTDVPEVDLKLRSNATYLQHYELNNSSFLHNKDILPPWTNLPRTQFTDNVLGIIRDLNLEQMASCPHYYSLKVQTPNSVPPEIVCQRGLGGDRVWCEMLEQIFRSRPLPYNVSISFSLGDYSNPDIKDSGCIGSSSPGGKLVMPNMEDIQQMLEQKWARVTQPELYRWQYKTDVPWEKRDPRPVFRGTAWPPPKYHEGTCLKPNFDFSKLIGRHPRYRAVGFSADHPSLLNAKFHQINREVESCFSQNDTSDFDKLLPVDPIPNEDYFANYQVALVLAGMGAAFRTSNHFMTGTAVVLQDFVYQEWYTKYLQPYVHYIPVSEDLHDLNATMHWIQDHPVEVHAIALNGRAFYEKYLTFARDEDHIFELVYRLSEYTHDLAANRQ